jgi:O-acetyl-ADP-ribose deacetylase (regulator of RNase III)
MSDTYRVEGVELVQGDITRLEVDAIVNPSNPSLILGAGVSGAIATAGGPSIQKEMIAIGGCFVGGAVITGAGLLPCNYVIHAVGPRMGEGDEDRKLRSTTIESIRRAEENKLTSIAFPAISTGIFGYPLNRCAEIMIAAALAHLRTTESKSIIKIVFCLFGGEAFDTFKYELKRQTKG